LLSFCGVLTGIKGKEEGNGETSTSWPAEKKKGRKNLLIHISTSPIAT
jgi:hypothetical protein